MQRKYCRVNTRIDSIYVVRVGFTGENSLTLTLRCSIFLPLFWSFFLFLFFEKVAKACQAHSSLLPVT